MTNAEIIPAHAHGLFETLEQAISHGGQKVEFFWLGKLDKFKVRIRIVSDPYRFQCVARAEVWSAEKLAWNEVATRPTGDMETPIGLYVRPNKGWNKTAHFMGDYGYLLGQIANILL